MKVRHEITLLSSYLNIIKENFTKDDVSQHTKHDLQKILAWFIIDYFTHNIDLIAQARKNFRPQNSNDDTAITEQSDYVWDPEWSHPAFISFPQSISSQAIGTISYIRDYVRVIPLTIDATPLNYNTFLPDTQNNSLNSTVIHNENLNGTRNLTQQDIQTPSHFINEETVHTTTTQQSISPIRPNLTTPRNTNPSQTQVTLQSTVKPSVAPKYSHMDYQTYRPMTIPSKTRKTFTRNNFADHNYNYTHPSKTYNQPQRNFNQYTRSRNWDNPMAQPNSTNFQTNPPRDHSENYPFFQQNKNKKQTSYQMDYLSSDDDFLQPDIFAQNTQEYRRQGIQRTRTNHRNFSPQPIDAQNQQPIQQQNPINTQSFQPIQQQNPMTAHSYQPSQMQNEIPLPYYLQQHEITRNQLSNFSQMPNAAESLQMTMNPYLMGGSSITSNKPLMVFTGTDPEYSVEDYLNAVTANLILNIGPEPINTPLHQNWIHRRTALIQTTLDGAAQKWFSVLPLEIKSNWKRFTQEFSKMFDSERNKQQQRVLCNEIRRLPNETIKQIAVRIETLVRKAYSLNTHDYKNTKMTEILMMTLTPQLRKIAIKKRASHPSSIREPDLDFRKLVDKLEQAEITMKLEETKGPISPSSEGNSYIMVIVDAFTHYVALNPVPHCNAYYAYTTLYEHWIAKFGLPEILVTDNGTEFINNEIITLCHLYNIKHKPRTSHAPWTNGLVEGMNRSLQEYLRCIINGNDTKYTEWSADVKLFPLAYNSQITTTLGMSPYEMVFNQKPRKPIMFTANSHKNAQGYCQPNKDSICYNLPLHTHDEDHFHHPQILKLASGTHTEWILNRDKKHNEIYQKITKKLLQRQNINEQINSRFTPASELKIGTIVLIPNFNTQKGISKKLQPLRKGPYQIIAKPTDVTYKITDSNKKEIVQHRNNLLPYYPKEYALRELTQLYSFTGLKIIQNKPHLKNTEQNDNPTENQNTKPIATKNNTQNHKESPKQRKNRKMTEQIIPQEQIDKSENRKTTRLRNQPRKNYKIFIPQSKILKKVEFQK